MPQSAYSQMIESEVLHLKGRYLTEAWHSIACLHDALIGWRWVDHTCLDSIIFSLTSDSLLPVCGALTNMVTQGTSVMAEVKHACDNMAISTSEVKEDLEKKLNKIVDGFRLEAEEVGTGDDIVNREAASLKESLALEVDGVLIHNAAALGRHLTVAQKKARTTFEDLFATRAHNDMPKINSALDSMAAEAQEGALKVLHAVPAEVGVADAESSLMEFIELLRHRIGK
ncbi:unnamed protein product, partial [Chrysoparadoxa australica]